MHYSCSHWDAEFKKACLMVSEMLICPLRFPEVNIMVHVYPLGSCVVVFTFTDAYPSAFKSFYK